MSAVAKPEPITAHALKVAIQQRYEAPEWNVETEVTLGNRRLDVVALNMWGARDYRIVGFEIKVSRGDWLRELDAFQKSEEWTAVVDSFYVVTPPKLVRADELPAGWGLLELCGSRMMTRAHAAVREGRTTIPREVAARFIMRLAQRDVQAHRTELNEIRRELSAEIAERLNSQHDAETARTRDELATLQKQQAELLAALGIPVNDWHRHEKAMRAAAIFATAQGDTSGLRAQLERNAKTLTEHAQRIQQAADALNEPNPR